MTGHHRHRLAPAAAGLALFLSLASAGCAKERDPSMAARKKAYHGKLQRRLISAIHHSQRDKRSLDRVKKLLAAGASIEQAGRCSRHWYTTPLIEAVVSRDEAIVELLLARGAKVNAVVARKTVRWTPLHHAIRTGQYYVVKALLARGASLEAAGKHGKRPLHVAAGSDMPGLVKLLLNKGAKVNVLDKRDRTPLDYANYESVRTLLIRAGAKRARAFHEAPASEPAPAATAPAATAAAKTPAAKTPAATAPAAKAPAAKAKDAPRR